MSETKHTPGPWRVANGVQIRSQRDQIAKIWMMRNGEGNANARLIAAAPELLEALQTVVANAPEPYCAITRAVDAQCRAAIAKATGERQ